MPRRRILRIAALTTAIVAAVVAVLLFGLPMLVDLPSVRTQLTQKLSQATHVQISWDSLHVRLLPSPRGVLRGVRVEIPGRASMTMEQADAILDLGPLFLGRAEIDAIVLTRPVVKVNLTASEDHAPSSPPTDFVSAYRKIMAPLIEKVRTFAPDSTISIEAATVALTAPDTPPLELRELVVRVRTGVRGADLEVSTGSNAWDKLHLIGRVEFADLSAQAKLELSGLRPQPWLDRMTAKQALTVSLPSTGLQAQASTDGKSSLRLAYDVAAPSLELGRAAGRLNVADVHIAGTASADPRGYRVEVSQLQAGKLLSSAQANLNVTIDGQHPDLGVRIAMLDLATLRDAALALGGDQTLIAEHAPRIRGGVLNDLRLDAAAESWETLFDPSRMKAELTLAQGNVVVPKLEQTASDLAAHMALAEGIVRCDSLSGRLGESRWMDANATYGLRDGAFSADVGFQIDLRQSLDLARSVLPADQRAQLDIVTSASGRLPGRIQVRGTKRTWDAALDIAQADARASLKPLPWPVALRSAKVAASARQVTVTSLSASLGQSQLEQATLRLALGAEPRVESATANATVALGEIYPWLREQKPLADALRQLTSVDGSARITLRKLAGALSRPAQLRYEATLQPGHILIAHEQLPGQLEVSGGSIALDPATLSVDRVHLGVLDAHAAVSGRVMDYASSRRRIELGIAGGEIGQSTMQYVWTKAKAPARFQPRAPLRFTVPRAAFGPEKKLEAQAIIDFAAGTRAQADVLWQPDVLDVRRLAIKDRSTDATLSFSLQDRLIDARFAGTLDGSSVNRMLHSEREHPGVLQGDLRLSLDLDLRGRTAAQGRLRARTLDLSWLMAKPLRIEHLDLDADGEVAHIREAKINWAQQVATISGDVRHGERSAIVHAQIDSPGLVIDALMPDKKDQAKQPAEPAAKTQPAPSKGDGKLAGLWPLPVTGEVKMRSDFVQYGRFRVTPVVGTLTLEERRIELGLSEAQLCGISFPLTVEANPQGFAAAAHIAARGQQLEHTARCLTDGRVLITGAFDLRADLKTSGKKGELVRNLEGSVEARARDGKVMKFALIGNILSLKSIAGLFRRGPPKLSADGFAYSKIDVAGRLHDGHFSMDEAAFDSDAVGLAAIGSIDLLEHDTRLTVLVAPFEGVDRVVRKIPLIGYVLGGVLTSVPVGVSGDIRNPAVIPLGPVAVTRELAGIFERTLKLPQRLFSSKKAPGQEPERMPQ